MSQRRSVRAVTDLWKWARTLHTLRGNLGLSRRELEEIQRQKLLSLLQHAYERVPYYRRLMLDAGITPAQIRGVEELSKIPTTGKRELQSVPREDIVAQGIDVSECVSDVTSGSTGIPLRVWLTREDYYLRSLMFIRTFMEFGYSLLDRQAVVCDTRFVSSKRYWFQRLGVFRKLYVPVQTNLTEQLRLLREYRPEFIHGYAVSLGIIANELLKDRVDDIAPKMVCTGAELVSRATRRAINTGFKVDMIDTYATIESGLIAWECSAHKGYHINIDGVVVEFLKGGRPALPGERAQAVVTNLHSYAMPIIRYEVGDVCIPSGEPCTCGRELPLMSIIEGRIDDMVYTPSGAVVSPNSITNAMEAVDGIGEFRVIQEEPNSLTVLLVKGNGYVHTVPSAVRQVLQDLAGPGMSVEVRIVDKIPQCYRGKIRAVISLLTRDETALS